MSDTVTVTIDGKDHEVTANVSVLAALAKAGVHSSRKSVSGESRAPLCGMGVCFECRVTIDGRRHVRACMTLVEDNMDILTDGD